MLTVRILAQIHLYILSALLLVTELIFNTQAVKFMWLAKSGPIISTSVSIFVSISVNITAESLEYTVLRINWKKNASKILLGEIKNELEKIYSQEK